jgi:hypothetical protein
MCLAKLAAVRLRSSRRASSREECARLPRLFHKLVAYNGISLSIVTGFRPVLPLRSGGRMLDAQRDVIHDAGIIRED